MKAGAGGTRTGLRASSAAFKASHAWSDLGTIGTYPVLEVDAVLKMVGAK